MTNPWTPVSPQPEDWNNADFGILATEDGFALTTEDGFGLLWEGVRTLLWTAVSGSAPPWTVQ